MLRKLLDGHIVCEPIMEGGRAGYRFTATGTFDRLLTGQALRLSTKVVEGTHNRLYFAPRFWSPFDLLSLRDVATQRDGVGSSLQLPIAGHMR